MGVGTRIGVAGSIPDIVIAGSDAGSKLARANELGITIWDESELDRAISDAGLTDERK